MKRLIVLLSALLLAVMPVQAKAQEQGDVTAKCYTEAGSVEGLEVSLYKVGDVSGGKLTIPMCGRKLTGYTGKPPGTGITHLGAWKLQNLTRGDTGQVSPFKHTTWYNIIVGGEAGIVSGL